MSRNARLRNSKEVGAAMLALIRALVGHRQKMLTNGDALVGPDQQPYKRGGPSNQQQGLVTQSRSVRGCFGRRKHQVHHHGRCGLLRILYIPLTPTRSPPGICLLHISPWQRLPQTGLVSAAAAHNSHRNVEWNHADSTSVRPVRPGHPAIPARTDMEFIGPGL